MGPPRAPSGSLGPRRAGWPLRARLAGALYDGAWRVALTAAPAIAPLLPARRRSSLREALEARSGRAHGIPPAGERPRILVHGVSVGEVKAARPLVERLVARRGDLEPFLTSSTASGAGLARAQHPDLAFARLPFDAAHSVERFLDAVRPAALLLLELELWPNLLDGCRRRGIPVAVLSARITERSARRYARLPGRPPLFERLDLVAAQDTTYAQRLAQLGVPERVLHVTGNLKFDGLKLGRRRPPEELLRRLGAFPGRPLWVCGSTHGPEERLAVEAWRKGAPTARLVLVPRHVERAAALAPELARIGPTPQLLSELRAADLPGDPDRPLLVDTVGELEGLYGAADLAFVGGSLENRRGGQNVLEPASQAVPVLSGPDTPNFRQEVDLLTRAGGLVVVRDGAELGRAAAELLADPARREHMGSAGLAALEGQSGAAERTFRLLEASGILPPALARAGG